jgi:hypothetical protein
LNNEEYQNFKGAIDQYSKGDQSVLISDRLVSDQHVKSLRPKHEKTQNFPIKSLETLEGLICSTIQQLRERERERDEMSRVIVSGG